MGGNDQIGRQGVGLACGGDPCLGKSGRSGRILFSNYDELGYKPGANGPMEGRTAPRSGRECDPLDVDRFAHLRVFLCFECGLGDRDPLLSAVEERSTLACCVSNLANSICY